MSEDLVAMNAADIPFDGDCISHDLMLSAFNTSNDGNIEEPYQKLKQAGKGFLLTQPPHIDVSFENSEGRFLIDPNNTTQNYEGKFKKQPVYLPDFENSSSNMTDWWAKQLTQLTDNVLKYRPDSFILTQNSPKLENVSNCELDQFPFLPTGFYPKGRVYGRVKQIITLDQLSLS